MTMMRGWRAAPKFGVVVVIGLAGLGLGGCRGGSGGNEIVYDTIGGAPAVLNPVRGQQSDSLPWRFDEDLRVGGDQLYDRKPANFALDAGILADGGTVVLDAGNRRVLRFGPDGAYEGAFGEEGDGPGQFRNPFMLEVADTVVYVLDIALNRVNAFGPDGRYLYEFTVDLHGLAGTTPVFEAGGPDEIYVAGEPVPFMSQVRDTGRAVIYRLDHTGRVVDTLLTYPGSSWTPIDLPNGRTSFAKPRFGAEPRLDARPGIAAASYIPTYVIDVRAPDGRPTLRIARHYDNVPVLKPIRDSVLDRLASGPNRIPREALASIPFESTIPAIEGLTMDDRRRIWVDPYVPDEPTRRDLFDAQGRFQGPVYLPESMHLKDIRGGRACGAVHDADDRSVQIVCYRITEPPPKA